MAFVLIVSGVFAFFLHRLEFSRSFLPPDLMARPTVLADDCILCADAARYARALFAGSYLGLRAARHPLGVILTGAVAEPLATAGMPRPLAISVTLAFWQALAAGVLFLFLRRQGVRLVSAIAAPLAAMTAFGTVTTLSVIDNYGTALFGAALFLLAAGEVARHAARHPRIAGLLAGVLAGVLAGWGHLPNVVFVLFYSALVWNRLPAGPITRAVWSVMIPGFVAAALAFAPTVAVGLVGHGPMLSESAKMIDRYASFGHFVEPRTVLGYATSFFVFAWTAPIDAVQCRFPPEAVASIIGSLPRLADAAIGVGLVAAGLTAGLARGGSDRSDARPVSLTLAGTLALSFLFYLYFNPQEVLLYSSQWTTACIVAAALVFKQHRWLPVALILSVVLGVVVNVPPLYNAASFDSSVCCPLPSY